MQQFNYRLIARVPLTSDVSMYRFEEESGLFAYAPGQFVSLLLTDPTSGARVVRSYSIAGAHEPIEVGTIGEKSLVKSRIIELIIEHVPEGKGTTILRNLPIGSTLKAMGPAGNLTLKLANVPEVPLVFCANSTGIAPFCAMIQYLARVKIYPEIYVFWGLKTVQDVYLAEMFEMYGKLWAENASTFTMKICLSRETALPENVRETPPHLALGRIQVSMGQLPAKHYHFYICGGKSFVADIRSFVATQYPDTTIYFERFN